MKIAIVGATGSIGSRILRHVLRHDNTSSIIAITRKPLPPTTDRMRNVVIPDFGDLASVSETTWSSIQDADALIWAMGTYDLNENVNLNYPLEFQKHLSSRQSNSRMHESKTSKFRYILLGGAFTETNQSRYLYFLPDQRRMKGLLQTKTLELAEVNNWAAHVIRPGGVLMSDNTIVIKIAETIFPGTLVIRGEELGAFVANLAVNGADQIIIQNLEMVKTGRSLIVDAHKRLVSSSGQEKAG